MRYCVHLLAMISYATYRIRGRAGNDGDCGCIWSYIVCRQFDETLFCSIVTRSNVGVEKGIVLYEFGVPILDSTEGEVDVEWLMSVRLWAYNTHTCRL